jgi:hypothetical protein
VINLKFDVDPGKVFERALTELEQSQVPFATSKAINETAYQIRQQWAGIAPKVFKSPVRLTVKAAMYKKGTKSKPAAEIFIRDEAFKGNSPAQYLRAQVLGGQRRRKGYENALERIGALPQGQYTVPGKYADIDSNGNIRSGQLVSILSQLKALHDSYQHETVDSREKRQKKERRAGGVTTDYMALNTAGSRKGGIYKVMNFNFGGKVKKAIRPVLIFVSRAFYRKRYDIFEMAQTVASRRMPEIFKNELEKAVKSTFNKKFGL